MNCYDKAPKQEGSCCRPPADVGKPLRCNCKSHLHEWDTNGIINCCSFEDPRDGGSRKCTRPDCPNGLHCAGDEFELRSCDETETTSHCSVCVHKIDFTTKTMVER